MSDTIVCGGRPQSLRQPDPVRQVPADVTFVQHDCNQDFDFADDSSIDGLFAGEVIEHIFDHHIIDSWGKAAGSCAPAVSWP